MQGVAGRRDPPQGGIASRIGWALAFSVALHALALVAIRAGPPRFAPSGRMPIEARLALPEPRIEPRRQADAASLPPSGAGEPLAGAPLAGDARASEPQRRAPAALAAPAEPAQPAAEARGLPLDADRPYHLIAALDRPPVPLSAPDACYPHGARGEVAYELMIDEAGIVNQARIEAVQPAGVFTAAAVELCSAIRFSPAIKDGRAVRSKVRLVVGRG